MTKVKDVTNDLTQWQRGLLFYNCGQGLMIDKKGNQRWFKRNFRSEKIEDDKVMYYRTGEIYSDGNYLIVYRSTN